MCTLALDLKCHKQVHAPGALTHLNLLPSTTGTSSVAQQAPGLLHVNTSECISPFEHALKMYLKGSESNAEMVCLSLSERGLHGVPRTASEMHRSAGLCKEPRVCEPVTWFGASVPERDFRQLLS